MQQSSVSPLTSTELLKQLHWLPIEWRIRFKLACLVHKILHTGHLHTISQALKVHAFICQSLTFCSATQPFIWCSRFPRRCAQNMELHTSLHPPVSNLLFLQTSSSDALLYFSPSRPLVAPAKRPDSLPRLWRYINLLLTYLFPITRF